MKLTAVLAGATTAILIPMATASEPALKAVVRVDAAGATAPVNRLVFGGFSFLARAARRGAERAAGVDHMDGASGEGGGRLWRQP